MNADRPAVRPASPNDVDLLHAFVVDLARDEDFPGEVTATRDSLADALFGPAPLARAVVAETGDAEPAGFALYSFSYSTVTGAATLQLEDLYVAGEQRGAGIGSLLLRHLAQVAVAAGCARFEWRVLRTNDAATRLYRRLGARTLDEIDVMRVAGPALTALADGGA